MSDYDDCWCEWVDIGVGMQRVTDNPECPEHLPLDPVWVHRWTRICHCPTPVHRMSCGVDATPKVVTT